MMSRMKFEGRVSAGAFGAVSVGVFAELINYLFYRLGCGLARKPDGGLPTVEGSTDSAPQVRHRKARDVSPGGVRLRDESRRDGTRPLPRANGLNHARARDVPVALQRSGLTGAFWSRVHRGGIAVKLHGPAARPRHMYRVTMELAGQRERPSAGSKAVAFLCSEVAHFTVEKAASYLGLGSQAVVRVAVDDIFQMRPDALREELRALAAEDLIPAAIIATAGTTDFGSIDPLPEISAIARDAGACPA